MFFELNICRKHRFEPCTQCLLCLINCFELESKSVSNPRRAWQIVWFGEEAGSEKSSEMGENVTTSWQNRWFGTLPISLRAKTPPAKTDQNHIFGNFSQLCLCNQLISVSDCGHRMWEIGSVRPIVWSRSPEAPIIIILKISTTYRGEESV